MKNEVVVKEATLDEALNVVGELLKFDPHDTTEYLSDQLGDSQHLILVAYHDDRAVGSLISDDRFQDGSLYCWNAAVLHEMDGQKILKSLLSYQEKWAVGHEYQAILIKVRNRFKAMLISLLDSGFDVVGFESGENSDENRLVLKKLLTLQN